jgi:hypothetical protein
MTSGEIHISGVVNDGHLLLKFFIKHQRKDDAAITAMQRFADRARAK